MWTEWFTAAISELEIISGIKASNLYKVKNKLKQWGLIEVQIQGGRKASKYKICNYATPNFPGKVQETSGQNISKVRKTSGQGTALIDIDKDKDNLFLLSDRGAGEVCQSYEEELIREAKEGDSAALMELWNKWRRFIYLRCSRYCKSGSHYDMDDIMQTAFIGFCKGLQMFDEDKGYSFMTYALYHIKSVVRHELLGIGRRVNPLDKAESLYSPLPCDEKLLLIETIPNEKAFNVSEAVIWQDAKRIMQEAVRQLNWQHRELVRLRFYEKLEYKDISEITGLTAGRARDEVLRAQRKLWGMKEIKWLREELFPPKGYRAPTDYTAVYNVEADRHFWSHVGRWA